MKNSPETLYRKDFIGSLSDTRREKKNMPYQKNYEIYFIEERLFCVKTQEIIDELTQIVAFIKELEKFGFENSETLEQIYGILSKLRSGDRNYKYTKIVHVLTKYLSGIRDFSSTIHTKNVIFYKRLFESTLVAIMRELDFLEEKVG